MRSSNNSTHQSRPDYPKAYFRPCGIPRRLFLQLIEAEPLLSAQPDGQGVVQGFLRTVLRRYLLERRTYYARLHENRTGRPLQPPQHHPLLHAALGAYWRVFCRTLAKQDLSLENQLQQQELSWLNHQIVPELERQLTEVSTARDRLLSENERLNRALAMLMSRCPPPAGAPVRQDQSEKVGN
ncbi:hypothetical protein [Larkinella soli]|uniref:hypothetical protein n=1 Tax=Larkinella soli TaxID=1770527 RepID=UPI000FFB85C5|nr:hypothetical protein [Larkinella soli]